MSLSRSNVTLFQFLAGVLALAMVSAGIIFLVTASSAASPWSRAAAGIFQLYCAWRFGAYALGFPKPFERRAPPG